MDGHGEPRGQRPAVTAIRRLIPESPGVYYLLGSKGEVLYAGKATRLRDRIRSHAKTPRWILVRGVGFEVSPSVEVAEAREADVLAALRPPWNRVGSNGFSFITIDGYRLRLGSDGEYGCFPHLERGALLSPARDCIDGFDALCRLVRSLQPNRSLLHRFLMGESMELLRNVPLTRQPHIDTGIKKDRLTAERFFRAGPAAMRDLRIRHHHRGPVTREQFRVWIAKDLQSALDTFVAAV